jgi:hypothetical protein
MKPYRGKYADRDQAQVMREAQIRAWQRHQKQLAIETAPRVPIKMQPRDVQRSVYLPPPGSIAFSLLYQVAR